MDDCNDVINKDLWLSGLLDRDSYTLNIDAQWIENVSKTESEERKYFSDLLSQKVFIQTKIDTLELEAIALLEAWGFHLIDTNVVFERTVFSEEHKETSSRIRVAENIDSQTVGELGRNSFVYSRFHLDPQIPVETANEIKSAWVLNFFQGKRGNQLLVAEMDQEIVGFNQLICGKDNSVCIDLIAVGKSFARQGIASALINYIKTVYGDKKRIVVGTQVSNIPSIRLYQKLGFRMCCSKYVFHYHNL
jgi:GNAT superfamily N-acetyltransferase